MANARALLLGTLTALALAAGCSGPQGAPVDEAALARVTAGERAQVFPPRPYGPAADRALGAFVATVAGCMRRAGHAYEAFVEPRLVIAGEDDPGPPLSADLLDGLDPAAWLPHARAYGYGYTLDRRLTAAAAALPPADDPNLEREQALAPEARRDYYVALYGPRFPDGQPVAVDELFPPDDPTAGCHGEAVAAHRPLSLLPGAARAELAALDAPAGEIDAARERWAACMHERGFELDSRAEAVQQAVGGTEVASAAGAVGAAGGWDELEVRRGDGTFVVAVPPPDAAALAGEQRLATADAECDLETGLALAIRQVRERRQSVFIARWRPELVAAGLLPGGAGAATPGARGG